MHIQKINEIIKSQILDNQLSDNVLHNLYIKSKSVKDKINYTRNILYKVGISKQKTNIIIKKLTNILIPPGTKSAIRGNLFNTLVAKELKKQINRSGYNKHVELFIEKKIPNISELHEIPDWYIKYNNNYLVGYNQYSLIGGGHQINRAGKYILDENLHQKLAINNIKLVCIIAENTTINSTKNKAFTIFDNGFTKKRLYYIGGIKEILHSFLITTKVII